MKLPCQFCSALEDRVLNLVKVTCFDCKTKANRKRANKRLKLDKT